MPSYSPPAASTRRRSCAARSPPRGSPRAQGHPPHRGGVLPLPRRHRREQRGKGSRRAHGDKRADQDILPADLRCLLQQGRQDLHRAPRGLQAPHRPHALRHRGDGGCLHGHAAPRRRGPHDPRVPRRGRSRLPHRAAARGDEGTPPPAAPHARHTPAKPSTRGARGNPRLPCGRKQHHLRRARPRAPLPLPRRRHVELLRAGAHAPPRRAPARRRTLQRKLSEEQTTFQKQLSRTRETLARHYLCHTDFTVGDIAFLLGYQETNSFLRAFVLWTGKTPAACRRRGRNA